MADKTNAELQAEIDGLNNRIDAMLSSPGFWAGLSKWLADNPVMAHTLNMLVSAASGALLAWLTGLGGSVVTKEVPGPERVVTKEVIQQVPISPGTVKSGKE